MGTVHDLNQKGLAVTRATPTPILVTAFRQTDILMVGCSPAQHIELATARGWIITVLGERGELKLIGLDEDDGFDTKLSPQEMVNAYVEGGLALTPDEARIMLIDSGDISETDEIDGAAC